MDVELGRVGGTASNELVDGEVRQSAAPGGEVSLYVSLDLANTIEEADTGSTRGTLS